MRKMHLPFLVLVALPFLSTAAPVCDPRIFSGDETTAYRDPAAVWHDGRCYLFFTLVETEDDGSVFSYLAESESAALVRWTPPRKLTPRLPTRRMMKSRPRLWNDLNRLNLSPPRSNT